MPSFRVYDKSGVPLTSFYAEDNKEALDYIEGYYPKGTILVEVREQFRLVSKYHSYDWVVSFSKIRRQLSLERQRLQK